VSDERQRKPAVKGDTERLRAFYDNAADRYDGWLGHYERWMNVGHSRRRLLSLARGRTLEVGVGTGVNIPYYPAAVQLTAIDLSPAMLELARQRAGRLGTTADLRVGDGEALEFPDQYFDTVTATHFVSVVADPQRAIAEISRVLTPGGRLLVLDHVRSQIPLVRLLQWALAPLAARFAGWHLSRDVAVGLTSQGFAIENRRRSRLGMLDEIVCRKADTRSAPTIDLPAARLPEPDMPKRR
jgi:ubiquinone/menaquinone biosynthesis C-methylase UbiE